MAISTVGHLNRAIRDIVFWLPSAILIGIAVGAFSGGAITSFKWLLLILGAMGVIITLARVEWALACLVFITFVNLSDVLITFHAAPPAAKYYVVAVLCMIFLRWMAKGEPIGGNPTAIVTLSAYALLSYLSAFVAEDPGIVIESSTVFVKDAVIALVVMTLLVNGASLRSVIWVLMFAGLLLSAATIYQYVTEAYPVAAGGFARAELQLIIEGEAGSYRHAGPLGDPNHFGQILVVILPLALERMISERRWSSRVVAGTIFLAVMGAVLLTYSRGAVLSVIGMGAVFVIVYFRGLFNLRNVLLCVCSLLVTGFLVAQVAPQSYLDRVETMTSLMPKDKLARGGIVSEDRVDVAVEGRLNEMKAALYMFFDNPLTGVGYANYEQRYPGYELALGLPPRHEERAAHSLFLEIAAEQGLIGLGSFAVILFVLARDVFSAVRDFNIAGDVNASRMAQALGFALLGYMICAMFLHNSYSRYLWLLAGIIFALPKMAAAARLVREESERPYQTHTSASAPLISAPR